MAWPSHTPWKDQVDVGSDSPGSSWRGPARSHAPSAFSPRRLGSPRYQALCSGYGDGNPAGTERTAQTSRVMHVNTVKSEQFKGESTSRARKACTISLNRDSLGDRMVVELPFEDVDP